VPEITLNFKLHFPLDAIVTVQCFCTLECCELPNTYTYTYTEIEHLFKVSYTAGSIKWTVKWEHKMCIVSELLIEFRDTRTAKKVELLYQTTQMISL